MTTRCPFCNELMAESANACEPCAASLGVKREPRAAPRRRSVLADAVRAFAILGAIFGVVLAAAFAVALVVSLRR